MVELDNIQQTTEQLLWLQGTQFVFPNLSPSQSKLYICILLAFVPALLVYLKKKKKKDRGIQEETCEETNYESKCHALAFAEVLVYIISKGLRNKNYLPHYIIYLSVLSSSPRSYCYQLWKRGIIFYLEGSSLLACSLFLNSVIQKSISYLPQLLKTCQSRLSEIWSKFSGTHV